MYFNKVYYDENGIPVEIEIICDKCGKIHSIDDMSIFNKITNDYCMMNNQEKYSCDSCGNIDSGMIGKRQLKTIEESTVRSKIVVSSKLYCPKCGSTAITTGPRGVNGFWGFIGASKTVNRCGKCGYTYEPRV